SLEDLLKEVSHLPDRSLIYYLHAFQDNDGQVLVPANVVALVAAKANAPIYGHVDSYIGRGMVGGRVFSWETEGTNAAKLALRILAEEKPQSMALPNNSENRYVFDGRQLRRWGVGQECLPLDSDIRYLELSFLETYRWQAVGVIALCV